MTSITCRVSERALAEIECNSLSLLPERGADVGATDYLGHTPCELVLAPRLAGTRGCDWHGAKNIAQQGNR